MTQYICNNADKQEKYCRLPTLGSFCINSYPFKREGNIMNTESKTKLIVEQKIFINSIHVRYGVSYSKIAEVAGVSDTTITRFMNKPPGSVSALSNTTLKKITDKYPASGALILKRGFIVKGCAVDLIANPEKIIVNLPANFDYSPNMNCWEFSDNDNAPMAYKGWLYITREENLIMPTVNIPESISPYLIKLMDGSSFFARILRGADKGSYNIIHLPTGNITESAKIISYAEIAAILPRY